jgi:hypothetical protein
MKTEIRLIEVDGVKCIEYVEDGIFKFVRADERDSIATYEWLSEEYKQACLDNWNDDIVAKENELKQSMSEHGFNDIYTSES